MLKFFLFANANCIVLPASFQCVQHRVCDFVKGERKLLNPFLAQGVTVMTRHEDILNLGARLLCGDQESVQEKKRNIYTGVCDSSCSQFKLCCLHL